MLFNIIKKPRYFFYLAMHDVHFTVSVKIKYKFVNFTLVSSDHNISGLDWENCTFVGKHLQCTLIFLQK